MCRREVPAFVLLRRLTFTSITTNDHPVLLLLPETLSSAPCKIATTFLKSKRIFKFFLFGKHHIHSSHTHFFFRTASLRFGPKMKRTAASNGVASPPSVVVAAEKPKRKKRRSAYDRTEREGDDETKKVV